uniref:ComF family protein n=1 Tax=Segatella salivae TaxID=228604 RepID=UPI0028DB0FFD
LTGSKILARVGQISVAFPRVRGHHVLLIDDVITTGATMLACAKELARAGEVTISVLSLGYAGR